VFPKTFVSRHLFSEKLLTLDLPRTGIAKQVFISGEIGNSSLSDDTSLSGKMGGGERGVSLGVEFGDTKATVGVTRFCGSVNGGKVDISGRSGRTYAEIVG
jgi:hypothetical protein